MGQPLKEGTGGVLRQDCFGQGTEHRAGVQAFLEQEGDRAGDVVAGDQGPLHGRRAAPGRQQGEMQVDPAMAGNVQGHPWDEPAIGHNCCDVRGGSRYFCGHGVVDFRGMDDLDAQFRGAGSHGRRRQHAFASERRVRPGQDCDNVKTRRHQRIQGGHSHGRCSGEKDPHWELPKEPKLPEPALPEPKLVPTVLARFAMVCSVMES